MNLIDLSPEYHKTYFNCLEDWSDEMKEAGDHKACWFRENEKKGLRVKLALDDEGTAVGMVQYLPIEESVADGEGLYFIPCIWVHGHKEGPGNRQGKGIGTALLSAAEEDARSRGAKGIAAWGVWIPVWMKASWFKKHGYKKADRDSMSVLLWKPFSDDAVSPRWVRQKKPVPRTPGKVLVTAFNNGWCQVENIAFERARRASLEFGDAVVFDSIDTSDPKTFAEWGIADGIYVDGKKLGFGPPLTYDRIKSILAKKVSRLRSV